MLDPPRTAFPPARLIARNRAGHRRGGRPSQTAPAWVVVVAVLLVVVVVAAFVRVSSPPPVAAVHVTLAKVRTVPPGAPALPWPATGQSAVAIPALGYSAQSGAEHPTPVASLTKIMTAYIVLRDHPLSAGESGPKITVTAADAADYGTDVVSDQSSVQITQGEVLTEGQLVAGMLVRSANDFAYALALWDAGSLPAFVAKMNATAKSLGMAQTHYVDASGFTPSSVSTPSDLLKVTAAAMAVPVFAKDVTMPSITLPEAGTVSTYTPLLWGSTGGVPGVVGVKSGYTTQAGGGDVMAYQSQSAVGGHTFVVLAATTSQQGPDVLDTAGEMDLAVARAAAAAVEAVPVASSGEQVGKVTAAGGTAPVVAAGSGSLLAWPGQQIDQAVVATRHLRAGAPASSRLGTALFTLGEQQIAIPVRTAALLPDPHLTHRLF